MWESKLIESSEIMKYVRRHLLGFLIAALAVLVLGCTSSAPSTGLWRRRQSGRVAWVLGRRPAVGCDMVLPEKGSIFSHRFFVFN